MTDPRRPARRRAGSATDRLEPDAGRVRERQARRGPLLAVCGLCGGAGASTLATSSPCSPRVGDSGPVLVCDTGGPDGGLADHAGVAAPRSLVEVGRARDRRSAARPRLRQRRRRSAGARHRPALHARLPGRRRASSCWSDARGAHALTVVDCGTLDPRGRADRAGRSHTYRVGAARPRRAASRRGERVLDAVDPYPLGGEISSPAATRASPRPRWTTSSASRERRDATARPCPPPARRSRRCRARRRARRRPGRAAGDPRRARAMTPPRTPRRNRDALLPPARCDRSSRPRAAPAGASRPAAPAVRETCRLAVRIARRSSRSRPRRRARSWRRAQPPVARLPVHRACPPRSARRPRSSPTTCARCSASFGLLLIAQVALREPGRAARGAARAASAGEALIAGLLAANVLVVGAALGAYGARMARGAAAARAARARRLRARARAYLQGRRRRACRVALPADDRRVCAAAARRRRRARDVRERYERRCGSCSSLLLLRGGMGASLLLASRAVDIAATPPPPARRPPARRTPRPRAHEGIAARSTRARPPAPSRGASRQHADPRGSCLGAGAMAG